MADAKSNRVQVELRLLQDKNLDALREAFEGFAAQVDRLVTEGVKTFEAAAGAGAPTGGRHASRAQPLSWSRQVGGGLILNRPAGPSGGGGPIETQSPGQTSPQASRGRLGGLGSPAFWGFDNPNMSEYERGMFSLGHVGQGWLASGRYLSHVAQRLGQKTFGAEITEAGDVVGGNRLGRGLVTGGGALGGLIRGITYTQPLMRAVEGHLPIGTMFPTFANARAMSDIGSSYGLSRSGWLGTPFMSQAFRRGVSQNWEAWQRSRWGGGLNWNPLKGFGLLGDPNYTREQSSEALDITRQYGWEGAAQDRLLDVMRSTTKKYGGKITQEQVQQLMEPALRFGTTSQSEVEDSFRLLAEAAKSANISLDALAQTAIPAAQAIAKTTGISGGAALRKVAGYTLATGRGADSAEAVLGERRNILLAAAQTGSLYDVMHGTGEAEMRASQQFMGELGDPNFWKRIKDDPRAMRRAMEDLSWFYLKDPSYLSGMTPDEWRQQMLTSARTGVDPASMVGAFGEVGKAVTPKGKVKEGKLRAALEKGGIDQTTIGGVMEAARTGKTSNETVQAAIDELKLGTVEGEDEIEALANRVLGASVEEARAGAAGENQAMIGVKAPFDDIFKVMIKEAGLGKSKSNQKGSFARRATGDMSFEEKAQIRANIGRLAGR